MMLTHECGHCIHAVLSNGQVTNVSVPLVGFSETTIDPNPSPRFVAYGGAVWGVVIPSLLLLIWKLIGRPPKLVWYFAGFCLIANGLYLAAGAMLRVGDARDLLRLGAPKLLLVVSGCVLTIAGLWLWHISRCISLKSLFAKE